MSAVNNSLNNIPKGYKQTEVGVIPEDWDLVSIGDISEMKSGQTITSKSIAKDGYYPCYGGNGIRGYTSTYNQDGEYVLIGRQGALCGNIEYVFGQFFASEHALVVSTFNNKNYKWLSYVLERMNLNQYSESSAQPGLSAIKLKKLKLALPPLPEQTAIATALSDIDNLIALLEKLIAKKEAIKTGAMQQLLTGQTRLPEFATDKDGKPKGFKQTELGLIPKDWEFDELGSIANVKGGKRLPKGNYLQKVQTKFPYIRVADMYMGGVNTSDLHYLNENTAPLIKNYRIFSGELFISVAGTIGLIGEVPTHLNGANLTENADRICNIKVSPIYLKYYLSSTKVQESIFSQITIGAQPKLAIERIKNIIVITPKLKEEQTAIATILTDMDAEIEALQTRLHKTRDIKQGMMQQLLTGRVRLLKPNADKSA